MIGKKDFNKVPIIKFFMLKLIGRLFEIVHH